MTHIRRRAGLRLVLAAAACACALRAGEPQSVRFDLPEGDALETLKLFAEQSGEQVVYFVDKVRGVGTHAVSGEMSPRAALELMLRDTRLQAVQDERTGAFSVVEKELPPSPLIQPAVATAPAARQSAPEPSDEIVRLPEFSVTEAQSNPYHAAEAISAARIRGRLLDTPISIRVVTRDLLDDVGAGSAYDATRYLGGVSNGRGAGTAGGIMDREDFRGFESNTRTVDNFSGTFYGLQNGSESTSIDTFEPAFIERAEIVLGPDAILNPNGTPGGSINIVTKSPLFTQQSTVSAEVGNASAQKLTVDTTGPIEFVGNGRLAYRVIAAGQDTKTYIPGRFRKYDVAAELAYEVDEHNIITFKYFGVSYEAYGSAAAPNDNGWLIYDPSTIREATIANQPPASSGSTYDGVNGVDTSGLTTERTNTAQLVYTGTLFDLVSVRLGSQFLQHNNVGDSAYPNLPTTEQFDNNTGQVIGVPQFDPTSVPEVWRYNHDMDLMTQVENDYAANLKFGSVSFQPIAGWAFQRNVHPLQTTEQTPASGPGSLPNANLFAGPYGVTRPDLGLFLLSARNKGEDTRKEAYALAKLGFVGDRIFLLGGATRTWVNSHLYTYNAAALSAPPTQTSLDEFKDCVMGSILVKPLDWVSCYDTYSTNAQPAIFTPNVGANVPLWSQGKQNELGLKVELFGQRLAFTADRFEIKQTNFASSNPLFNVDPLHNPSSILTDNTNHGVELNLDGGLTENLSVIASTTDMKFRDAFGRQVRNVPDSIANLLALYRFSEGPLKNLSVFGAVERMGRTAGESQTGFTSTGAPKQVGFYVASWTVVNAGAGYRWDRYRFNLNVDNVLDSKFAWEPSSRLSVSPYPGTAVRFTAEVKF